MRPRALLAALVGIVTAGVAIGVGELVAVLVRPAASPVIAVGNRVITLTPSSTKRSAESSFGTNDKTVLIASILALLVVFGLVIGDLALRRLAYGLAGVGALAAFGAYCAVTQPGGRGGDVVPTLAGGVVAAAVLAVLVRTLTREEADDPGRRRFLLGGLGAAVLAAVAGFGGRALQHRRFDVTADRAAVALPKVPETRRAKPDVGFDLGKGAVPWATSAAGFYRIDTALSVPQLSTQDWLLRIHGMVDRELTLVWSDLLRRPMIERWITLCCVSNLVGGDLISNARWQGTLLAPLLREAGVQSGADQLLMTSVDNMTIGAPTRVVMDGRDAMLAIGMNGAPLPVEHGFPARVVVPGLYGYVSACKWVVDIEATTFADRKAYWIQGGWAQQNSVKIESRIDTPRSGAKVTAGRPVTIAGVAWDQHVGVSKVEVQVGRGPWLRARLAGVPSTDTWRQWVVSWTPPKPGAYEIRVRATDARGVPQTTQYAEPFPSGSTGFHVISVHAN